MFGETRPTADNNWKWTELFMEAVGTFTLTYFAALSVMMTDIGANTSVGNAIAQFIVLAFIIYAGANISGANYNAAVTLALMCSRHLGCAKGCMYLLAQFFGAIFSAVLLIIYKYLYHGPGHFKSDLGYPHCNTKDWNLFVCFAMECLSTMFLVQMVYKTAINKTKPDNGVYGFCIAGTLGLACLTIGSVTGAGLNPWRILPASIFTGQLFTGGYDYAWVYYVGEPLAGIMVGLMWRCIYEESAAAADARVKNEEEENVRLREAEEQQPVEGAN